MQTEIDKALHVLRNGGTLLYPTDTVWGIGCDATNAKAVDKVYAAKQRPKEKSFIILVDEIEKLTLYLEELHIIAVDLINSYNKPLTIVYPKAKHLAKNAVAADGSIAIRVVKDKFCKELIHQFGKPIVSTSANVSGEDFAYAFNKISPIIKNAVDYIVDPSMQESFVFKPSTMIKLLENGEFIIIRE